MELKIHGVQYKTALLLLQDFLTTATHASFVDCWLSSKQNSSRWFSVATALVLNSCPQVIRNCETLATIKKPQNLSILPQHELASHKRASDCGPRLNIYTGHYINFITHSLTSFSLETTAMFFCCDGTISG